MASVRFDQRAFRRRWLELHREYERRSFRLFKKALDIQTKAIVDEIKANGTLGLDFFLTMLLPKAPMEAAYRKCWTDVGVRHARFTFNWIKELAREQTTKASIFGSDYFNQLMIDYYNRYGAQRVAEVDQTTKDLIAALLQKGRELNLTQSQLATFMVDNLNDKNYNRMRALRIGRTESTTAANQGAYLAGENSDYLTVKVWIAVEDNRTRRGHAEQNGEELNPTLLFNVARYSSNVLVATDLMLYPGDIQADVSQIVNCRCTLAYSPLLDADGLPILRNAA